MLIHCWVGKKTLHISDATIPWMDIAAKKMDKTQYPLAVSLFGAVGIMMIAQHLAYLLDELELRIVVKSRLIFHIGYGNITIGGKIERKSNKWNDFSTLKA